MPGRAAFAALAFLAAASVVRAQCSGCPKPSFAMAAPAIDIFGTIQGAAPGDFDGDAFPDAAVLNSPFGGSLTLSIFRGEGNGSLVEAQRYPLSGPMGLSFAVVASDLDGDGNEDVVVTRGTDSILTFRGSGDGTLQDGIPLSLGRVAGTAATGDANGDGFPDLAFTDEAGNTIWIALGDGLGGFGPPDGVPAGPQVGAIALADFNGDGLDDAIAVNTGADTVSVVFGIASGVIPPARLFSVGATPLSLAVSDWNGDGHPDIAVSNVQYGISTLLNTGDSAVFGPASQYPLTQISAIAGGDFDGNGTEDLFVEGGWLLPGDGSGSFGARQTWATLGRPVAVADFDRDGIVDVLGSFEGGIALLLGSRGPLVENYPPPSDSTLSGDFDGDGHADIVAVSNSFSFPLYPRLTLLWGDSSGFTLGVSLSFGASGVAAGDVNGDGASDLLVARFAGGDTAQMDVHLGGPGRTFTLGSTFDVEPGTTAITISDLDGDGRPDAAVWGRFSGDVSIFLGNGDGT
ncbi:MAG: FG-GAP repeat domain-containing protein, partial [Thermoanaerobaculia bacterium]